MKLNILDISKNKTGEVDLPVQFGEDIGVDLVKRTFLALQSSRIQPYGSMKEAGKRSSSTLSKRRRKYRGSYGFGISRTPRKVLSRRGTRMYWVVRFHPILQGEEEHIPQKLRRCLAKKSTKKKEEKR